MTLREAKRRVRVRMEEPNGAWWGDKFGTDAIETLIRALDRPTVLEREAAILLKRHRVVFGQDYFSDLSGPCGVWLARYERKRKVARRG